MDGPTVSPGSSGSNVHHNVDGSYDVTKSIPGGLEANYHFVPSADGKSATFQATGINSLTGGSGSGEGNITNNIASVSNYSETTAQGAHIQHSSNNMADIPVMTTLNGVTASAWADVQNTINPGSGADVKAALVVPDHSQLRSEAFHNRLAESAKAFGIDPVTIAHHIPPSMQTDADRKLAAQPEPAPTVSAENLHLGRMAQVPGVQAVLDRAAGLHTANSGGDSPGFAHNVHLSHTNAAGTKIDDTVTIGPNGKPIMVQETATGANGSTVTSTSKIDAEGHAHVMDATVKDAALHRSAVFTENTHIKEGQGLLKDVQKSVEKTLQDPAVGGKGSPVASEAPAASSQQSPAPHEQERAAVGNTNQAAKVLSENSHGHSDGAHTGGNRVSFSDSVIKEAIQRQADADKGLVGTGSGGSPHHSGRITASSSGWDNAAQHPKTAAAHENQNVQQHETGISAKGVDKSPPASGETPSFATQVAGKSEPIPTVSTPSVQNGPLQFHESGSGGAGGPNKTASQHHPPAPTNEDRQNFRASLMEKHDQLAASKQNVKIEERTNGQWKKQDAIVTNSAGKTVYETGQLSNGTKIQSTSRVGADGQVEVGNILVSHQPGGQKDIVYTADDQSAKAVAARGMVQKSVENSLKEDQNIHNRGSAASHNQFVAAKVGGSSTFGILDRPDNKYHVADSHGKVTPARPGTFGKFGERPEDHFARVAAALNQKDPEQMKQAMNSGGMSSQHQGFLGAAVSKLKLDKVAQKAGIDREAIAKMSAQKRHIETTGEGLWGAGHQKINQALGLSKFHRRH